RARLAQRLRPPPRRRHDRRRDPRRRRRGSGSAGALIDIRNLVGQSFETLTAAFNDAFSDYDIPANYTSDYLGQLVARRGFRPDLAVGAFDGDRLAGFVFNCLDSDEAYNSGTGVVISHRRRGIARQLMERSIETLPAKRYILEVIE